MNKLKDEEYKCLTNYNPYLLFLSRDLDIKSANAKIRNAVRSAVDDTSESLKLNKFEWIKENLRISMDMLISATNGFKIPVTSWDDYIESWVCAENITYVSNRNEIEFKLSMNFPMHVQYLIQMLHEHIANEAVKVHSSQIQGLYFEMEICTKIKEINVLYSEKTEAIATQDDLKAITFLFSCNSSMLIQGLGEGVLYHLRPGHPVIDAVAFVKVDDTPWLLLIQVSISAYKDHKSKAEHLLKEVEGYEKQSLKNGKSSNWLDYYRNLIPPAERVGLKSMYIYISTQDFIEMDVSSIVSHEYNLRFRRDPGYFFGLILQGSNSSRYIATMDSEVRIIY